MTDFFQEHSVLFALLCAALGIAWGLGLTVWIIRQPAGTARMQEIAHAVQEGASAYLRRQYTTIAVVAAVVFLGIGFWNDLGWGTAFGFLIGAVLSAGAGFIGMNVAVRSNVRTAEAAREEARMFCEELVADEAFVPPERDLIAAQPDVAQHVVAESVELAARFAHELCPSVRLDKRADPVAHQGDLSSRTSAPAPSPAYVSAPTSTSPSPRTR